MTRRRIAWIILLIVDGSFIAWGGMAAFWLDHLMGPHGQPILPAGFEGFTGMAWSEIVRSSPLAAGYMEVLYRTYGVYCLVFGLLTVPIILFAFRRGERWAWWTLFVANTLALLSAIVYDKTVNAIGPFEMTEYLGMLLVWVALALTAPFGASLLGKAEPPRPPLIPVERNSSA